MNKLVPKIIAALGLLAAFYAAVLSLVPAATPALMQTFEIESVIAAVVALSIGVYAFRKGGGWRWLAVAMIGPGLFVLMDSGIGLLATLHHG